MSKFSEPFPGVIGHAWVDQNFQKMPTKIEVLTKDDLLQFKKDLIEEFKKLLTENSKVQEPDYFKSKEAKRILKCSDSTLQYYRESGRLPFEKVGRTYYYTKECISKFMKSSAINNKA